MANTKARLSIEDFIVNYADVRFTDQQIAAMSTGRLLKLYQGARANRSAVACYWGDRCCEYCCEYVGSDEYWDEHIKPALEKLDALKTRLKTILNTRENVNPHGKNKGGKSTKKKSIHRQAGTV